MCSGRTGSWQCDKSGALPYWSVNAQDNSIVDNGLDSIAIVVDSGDTWIIIPCREIARKAKDRHAFHTDGPWA